MTENYLKYIVDEIHSAVMATIDGSGRPITCAVDIMDYDENSLFYNGQRKGPLCKAEIKGEHSFYGHKRQFRFMPSSRFGAWKSKRNRNRETRKYF